MALDTKVIVNQIDTLLDRYEKGILRSKYPDLSDLPNQEAHEIATLMAAAIDRLAPSNSQYAKNANGLEFPTLAYQLMVSAGILRALKFDYLAGNLQSITELIHADVFGDFLEMADYLLDQGYKDPAAVIAGSVLEEHLRKLCGKSGVSVIHNQKPKKADTLNSELASANVYSKLDQKSIVSWLDLRNKAAHGKYAEYTKEQVALMVQAIRDFITRHPA